MLRGAVIGLGMIGRHHARLLQSTPRVRFAGAVDPEGDHYGSVHDARLVFGSVADLLKALSPAPWISQLSPCPPTSICQWRVS